MTLKASTVLNAGIVVDKTKLAALSAADVALELAQVYNQGKIVVITENAHVFFGSKNLLDDLETGGGNWPLIIEQQGIEVCQSEVEVLQRATAIRRRILDAMKPAYNFQEVPLGWSLDRLQITTQLVRRLDHQGNRVGYSLGLKTAENVWNAAVAHWTDNTKPNTMPGVKADGYNRTAVFHGTYIQIGCQRVERYEFEQLALHKGWAFP